MEECIEKEVEPPLPEIDYAIYIVNILDEIGAVQNTSMGMSPLTWQEIKAWGEVTDTKLDTWELATIKNLSNIYTAELSHASNPKRASPYTAKVVAVDWGDKFAAALRSIKNNKG